MKPIYHLVFQNFLKLIGVSRENRIKLRYFINYRKWPNTSLPNSFNEKLSKKMIESDLSIYSNLVDKFKVRAFVSDLIGKDVLIPLLLKTENPEDLLKIEDWSNTVIKPSHASGMIFIFDEDPNYKTKIQIVSQSKKWLNFDYSKLANESQYENMERNILMERKITPKGYIPRDYKFHCFKSKNGNINYVLQLVDGRFGKESRGYYVNSFEDLVWTSGNGNHQISENEKFYLRKCIHYNELIMNTGFDYLRIDWYIENHNIYFGELTFTTGAGCGNEFGQELERVMFDFWEISDAQK